MDTGKFEKFFDERYKPQLQHFRRRASKNQRTYRLLQWSLLLLSILSAATVSLEAFFDWLPLKVCAALAAIVVSGLAAVLKSFGFQEKATHYYKICNDLENEKDLYDAGAERYAQVEDREQYFVMRIRAILNRNVDAMQNITMPPEHEVRIEAGETR